MIRRLFSLKQTSLAAVAQDGGRKDDQEPNAPGQKEGAKESSGRGVSLVSYRFLIPLSTSVLTQAQEQDQSRTRSPRINNRRRSTREARTASRSSKR